MAATEQTFVLKADPMDEATLAVFAEAVGRLGPDAGGPWIFLDAEERAGQVVQTWRSASGAELVLTDDFETGLRYLNLYGLPNDASRALLDSITATSPVASRRDFLRRAAAGDEQALYALGLIGGPADPEAIRLISDALGNAVPARRQIAAEAAALARWPELASPLSRAADAEDDPDLKRLFEFAAKRCR